MTRVLIIAVYSLAIVLLMMLITGGSSASAWMFAWGFACAMLVVFITVIMSALQVAKRSDEIDAREQERRAPRERP